MSVNDNLLFKVGKFAYRVLTPEYRDSALVVLSRALLSEPVNCALSETKPEMAMDFLGWIKYLDYWMDHLSSNGMSIIAIGKSY